MKKKISIRFYVIGVVSIVFTTIIVTVSFYNLFKKQIANEIRGYAGILTENQEFINHYELNTNQFRENIRITLINPSGDVLFESLEVNSEIDSHKNRPEFIEALECGEGSDIRNSETAGKKTIYYAVLLQNGNVLRVAEDVGNIWVIFGTILPNVLGVAVMLIILCIIISAFLTRQIIKPIEQMAENMDEIEKNAAYDELIPFAKLIHSQNKMRREFTSNVSHELKTPLTAISGYAQLIESGIAKEDDIQDFAKKINKESKRLLELIDDIINLSKLDEGNGAVSYEEINLLDVANECLNSLEIKAENKNITLSIVGESVIIKAYMSMIDELIYNLCDNAIRYNREGGFVIVSIYKLENKAVIAVKDNGIGIAKQHQAHVFERFYRVDKSHSKASGGTGLGLSIVKHVALYHKAEIEMVSEEGEGTEIKVIFQM